MSFQQTLKNHQVRSRLFQDIALMNEQERDGFIRKIGISAGDSDELEDDEEENDPEHHKYNCKKCQVSFFQPWRRSAVGTIFVSMINASSINRLPFFFFSPLLIETARAKAE